MGAFIGMARDAVHEEPTSSRAETKWDVNELDQEEAAKTMYSCKHVLLQFFEEEDDEVRIKNHHKHNINECDWCMEMSAFNDQLKTEAEL